LTKMATTRTRLDNNSKISDSDYPYEVVIPDNKPSITIESA
jgi:hypothetical protein